MADDGVFGMTCFVVTHRAQEKLFKGPTTFTFIPTGLEPGSSQDGCGRKGHLRHGRADIAQRCLKSGIVDEIRLPLAPVLLLCWQPLVRTHGN
jgi:hypothetical protein